MGHRQAVRHQTLTLTFPGFESLCPSQKNKGHQSVSFVFSFFGWGTGRFEARSASTKRGGMGFAFAARRSVGERLGAPVFGAEGFREEQAPPLRSRRRTCESSPKANIPLLSYLDTKGCPFSLRSFKRKGCRKILSCDSPRINLKSCY